MGGKGDNTASVASEGTDLDAIGRQEANLRDCEPASEATSEASREKEWEVGGGGGGRNGRVVVVPQNSLLAAV